VLLALRTRVSREGGEVTLVQPSAAVRRLIEVSGLDGIFVLVDGDG
jgi:anti-anti-sigma factor